MEDVEFFIVFVKLEREVNICLLEDDVVNDSMDFNMIGCSSYNNEIYIDENIDLVKFDFNDFGILDYYGIELQLIK